MRGRYPELPVKLDERETAELTKVASQRMAPYCEVIRAKALLLAAQGVRNVEIAAKTGQDPRTVSILRKDFGLRRLEALKDRHRPGPGRKFSP